MRHPAARDIISAVFSAACFVIFLTTFFEPRWNSNDDIAMSMVAHGYGIAKQGCPELFFSNVIWGYLVRAIPSTEIMPGYSAATLAVLTSVAVILIWAMSRLGHGWLTGLGIMALVLTRPLLFPQFTINAGLLTVASLVCLQVYGQRRNWLILCIACLLAYTGFLIRPREFLLILGIGLPFIPWRAILQTRLAGLTLLAMIALMIGSAIIDQKVYQTEQWRAFKALNAARTPITDYGAVTRLKQQTELLVKHGYSTNHAYPVSTG